MASSFSVSTIFKGKDRLSPTFKKMGQSATGFGTIMKGIIGANVVQKGFSALASGMKSFVTEASKIEDAVAGFTPLLGGVDKATQLVNRLNQEAATTPFQFEGISAVAKQLLPVMNGNIEATADTFRMLGDTAGGNIQKLESITRGYTKALLKGKPDMEALNMIAEAGVPIFSQMASTMGVAQEQLFELSKQGLLTNDDLTKTFQNMTREGGIFHNGMQIASETLSGRFSTLKDNIALTKAEIGTQLLPVLKPLIDRGIQIAGVVRNWVTANQGLINQKIQNVLDGIGKTIQIVQTLWNSGLIPAIIVGVAVFKTLTTSVAAYQAIMTAAKAAQLALNVAMTANPIGLIIAGVSALIAVIVLLVKNWDTVTEAFGRGIDWIIGKFQPLIDLFTGFGDKLKSAGEKLRGWFGGGALAEQLAINKENQDAPNRREAEARSRIEFQGNINVAGIPTGSTVHSTTRGAPNIRMNMLGAN